jgi:hypothetical protein
MEELVDFECATPTKRVRIRKFPVRRLPKSKTEERAGAEESERSSPSPSFSLHELECESERSSPTSVGDNALLLHTYSLPSAAREKVVLFEQVERQSTDAKQDDDVDMETEVLQVATRKPTRRCFKKKPKQQRQKESEGVKLLDDFHETQQRPKKKKSESVKLLDDFRVSYLKKAPQMQNETLRDFLSRDAHHQQHLKWQKLLEAALSLEQLHAQDVVHGSLQCRNILISADGSQIARVRNFGALYHRQERVSSASSMETISSQQDLDDDHTARWIAPECLDGAESTKESDVFSFGMCLLEAVTGAEPWGAVSSGVARVLQSVGRLPLRPAGFFQNDQWDLLERMCARDPFQRADMAFVIKHLRRFAAQEQRERVKQQRETPTVLYCGS